MATPDLNPILSGKPVSTVSTTDHVPASSGDAANSLYPSGIPDPSGTTKSEEDRVQDGQNTDPTTGTGTDGEVIVWEGHYSARNFIGRGVILILVVAGWIALAVRNWNQGQSGLPLFTKILGWMVLAFCLWLGWRMVNARYSHFYKLTNRRLFVSTGIVRRRRDMMELLRIKDVFTRQLSLLERMLSLGTVVVVSHEKDAPIFYLPGVDDPKQVMDLIWHHARAERDQRSVKVDSI